MREPCSTGEGSNACLQGHTCVDPETDGTGVCTLNQCVTTPSECLTDGCTPVNAVTVIKSATQSCSSSETQSVATYTIQVTNPFGSSRTFTITDDLDSGISDSYVSNISSGEVLSGGIITWSGIVVGAGSTITLTYQVTYPESDFGTTFQNIVVVTESGVERGRAYYWLTPTCTPFTALISDEADRILLGALLIIVGFLIYRFNMHTQIGKLFYEGMRIRDVRSRAFKWIAKGIGNQQDEREAYEKRMLEKISKDK